MHGDSVLHGHSEAGSEASDAGTNNGSHMLGAGVSQHSLTEFCSSALFTLQPIKSVRCTSRGAGRETEVTPETSVEKALETML